MVGLPRLRRGKRAFRIGGGGGLGVSMVGWGSGPSGGGGSYIRHLEDLGVLHATFVAPGLDVFCGLEAFGLVAVGRGIDPGWAVSGAALPEPVPWCGGCGAQVLARDGHAAMSRASGSGTAPRGCWSVSAATSVPGVGVPGVRISGRWHWSGRSCLVAGCDGRWERS